MTSDKERTILKEAQDRLRKAIDDDEEDRRLAKEDLEFIAIEGKQWPEAIKREREAEGRPCVTINKLPIYIDQVVGDQRMNRPSIKVLPVDTNADIKVAKLLSGWIKHVQQISKSDIAVDHAFEHAVACGYGALRVVTRYSSDSAFEQEAYIEKIDNALAVFWGKHSEYDCSDAMYCFIVSDMDKEEFKEKYKVEPIPFNSSSDQFVEGWATKDTVRIAEYFVKEPIVKTIYLLEGGIVVDKPKEGDIVLRTRKVQSYNIMWYLLTGDRVLDSKQWLGRKYIPVIPVWGKEFNVAGKRKVRGLIRNAKDIQRIYNYWYALSLDTLIPTPDGWLTMADLQVGHQVLDDKGKICNVTNISEVYRDRPCYEVLFDDGSTIIADETHLWTVEERGKRIAGGFAWKEKTLQTADLVPGNHFIWCTEPLDLPQKDLPIPPYVLGVWLGDGRSTEPCITQGKEDAPLMWAHLERFGCDLGEDSGGDSSTETRTILGIRHKFASLNLLNNKHIPYEYARGSVQQRLELLQGLMDTDGSINSANGACDFTTTSSAIASGFSELLHSLGIKAKFTIRDRSEGEDGKKKILGKTCNIKPIYQFYFTTSLPVFRLHRKFSKLGRNEEQTRRTKRYSIVSVTPVLSVPVKCITVDSPSSLYLAGTSMIPTHNSVDTETIALQPKSPFILTPKQIAGHEDQWKDAHKRNYPYLLANPDKDAPGWPYRQAPPQASSALVEKLKSTDQELRDVTGLQKASLGMQSNERSGAAIRERKKEGDIGTYAFIDNLSRSLEHVGRVLVDIAPVLLDTERMVRLGLDDGDFTFDLVNGRNEDGTIFNDLSMGTYDVTVTVGPSFTTQRTEARQSMQEFIQYYPAAAPIIGDLYAKSMDWPGAEQVAERLAFLLPPEIKAQRAAEEARRKGEPPPQPEQQPAPPPDPMMQAKLQEEQLKLQDLQIKLQQEQVKLQQEQARLEKMRIETEVMLAQSKENVKKLLDEIENEGKEGTPAAPAALTTIPGRAKGGGVNADQPYVVGELGPEIFVPAQEGLIVPNSEIVGADAGLKASEKFGASPEEDLSGGKLTSALTQFATATETEDDDKSKADNLMAKAKELMAMQSKLQGGKINAS